MIKSLIKPYFFIFITVILTTYGQLVVKWQISQLENMPTKLVSKLIYLMQVCLTNFYLISSFGAVLLGGLLWMSAIKNLPLNVTYPLMSLSFVLVFIFSSIFFHEKVSTTQIVGLACIVMGIVIIGIGSLQHENTFQ